MRASSQILTQSLIVGMVFLTAGCRSNHSSRFGPVKPCQGHCQCARANAAVNSNVCQSDSVIDRWQATDSHRVDYEIADTSPDPSSLNLNNAEINTVLSDNESSRQQSQLTSDQMLGIKSLSNALAEQDDSAIEAEIEVPFEMAIDMPNTRSIEEEVLTEFDAKDESRQIAESKAPNVDFVDDIELPKPAVDPNPSTELVNVENDHINFEPQVAETNSQPVPLTQDKTLGALSQKQDNLVLKAHTDHQNEFIKKITAGANSQRFHQQSTDSKTVPVDFRMEAIDFKPLPDTELTDNRRGKSTTILGQPAQDIATQPSVKTEPKENPDTLLQQQLAAVQKTTPNSNQSPGVTISESPAPIDIQNISPVPPMLKTKSGSADAHLSSNRTTVPIKKNRPNSNSIAVNIPAPGIPTKVNVIQKPVDLTKTRPGMFDAPLAATQSAVDSSNTVNIRSQPIIRGEMDQTIIARPSNNLDANVASNPNLAAIRGSDLSTSERVDFDKTVQSPMGDILETNNVPYYQPQATRQIEAHGYEVLRLRATTKPVMMPSHPIVNIMQKSTKIWRAEQRGGTKIGEEFQFESIPVVPAEIRNLNPSNIPTSPILPDVGVDPEVRRLTEREETDSDEETISR